MFTDCYVHSFFPVGSLFLFCCFFLFCCLFLFCLLFFVLFFVCFCFCLGGEGGGGGVLKQLDCSLLTNGQCDRMM